MKINNFHAMGNGKTEYKFKENIRHITDKEPLTKIQKKVSESNSNNFIPANLIWKNDMDILLIRANYNQKPPQMFTICSFKESVN